MAKTLDDRLEVLRNLIDEAIESEILRRCPRLGDLQAAMLYAAAGGKRLRGAVVVSCALSLGSKIEEALPWATAVEMVHAYSLVHDDLPCMDDDDMRRGKPTVHKKFGEALAVLSGDALLTMAFEVGCDPVLPADTAIRCARLLSSAAGSAGMVGGQVLDITYEGTCREPEAVRDMYSRKTAALFSAAAEIGGVLGHAGDDVCQGLREWGHYFGLAFQINDDLDDAATYGKEEEKATLARVTSVDLAREEAAHSLLKSYEALRASGVRDSLLGELTLRYARRIAAGDVKVVFEPESNNH